MNKYKIEEMVNIYLYLVTR